MVMVEHGNIGENITLARLIQIISDEIPDQQELLNMVIDDPLPEVVPMDFDGLLELKPLLQTHKVRIPRDEGFDEFGEQTRANIREIYQNERKKRMLLDFFGGFDPEKHILSKRDEAISFVSSNQKVFITPNEYPYFVNKNEDAEHNIVWVEGSIDIEIPRVEVASTIAEFLLSRNLGENDFLLTQHPPQLKTIPQLEHLHLFNRVK